MRTPALADIKRDPIKKESILNFRTTEAERAEMVRLCKLHGIKHQDFLYRLFKLGMEELRELPLDERA